MNTYPKIESVYPLPNYRLLVVFENEIAKVYDCTPLLKEEAFSSLASERLFLQARVGTGGYGVVWNDELDLSESELWLNGVEAEGLPIAVVIRRKTAS